MAAELTLEIIDQYTIDKKYSCEVCENEFTSLTLRMQKLRFVSSDVDLRPNYDPIDPLLYDVLLCPNCGYASLSMYFNKIASKHREKILQQVSLKWKRYDFPKIMTYRDACNKYKLALITAYAKDAKHSEMGYICLKIAWLYRLMGDNDGYMLFAARSSMEFTLAYENEQFPICQMDAPTLEYLLAYLLYVTGDKADSMKFLGRVITNISAPVRLKEKARELKELVSAGQTVFPVPQAL